MGARMTTTFMDLMTSLERDGFTEFSFREPELLFKMQAVVNRTLPIEEFQDNHLAFDQYAVHVKKVVDEVANSQFVTQLLKADREMITFLCGPDVDVQRIPHMRIS